jgi:hypothetical protein
VISRSLAIRHDTFGALVLRVKYGPLARPAPVPYPRPPMRKLLFALAALAATAMVVLVAWAVSALFTGALSLPKWALIASVVAILALAQLVRWRKRRP